MRKVGETAISHARIVSRLFPICCTIIVLALFQSHALAQGVLTNGANHSGAISTPGEIDTWTFQANKDDAISISIGEVFVSERDPGFWPWIQLRGPDGSSRGSS